MAAHQDSESISQLSFPKASVCRHCGQSTRGRASVVNSSGEVFCCSGCRSVFDLLHSEDLDSYYAMMSTLGNRPLSADQPSQDFTDAPDDVLAQLFSEGTAAGAAGRYACFVPSIHCAACSWLITTALERVEGVSGVAVDLTKREVGFSVETAEGSFGEGTPSQIALTQLRAALARLGQIGYAALPRQLNARTEAVGAERRGALLRLAVAGFCFGNVMLYSSALYLGEWLGTMQTSYRELFRFLSLGLAVPGLLYSAWPIFRGAWTDLLVRRPGLDLAVALALVVGTLASIFNLFWGDARLLYFDTVAGLIFVVLLSRFLNESVLERAQNLSLSAARLLPERSRWVEPGEEISVSRGEAIPADGILCPGESAEISEAALTGEFAPVVKQPGSTVFAGTENLGNPFRMLVQHRAEESRVAGVQRLIDEARLTKGRWVTLAERAIPIFVGTVLGTALLNVLVRFALGQTGSPLFESTVAILVIGCPCALAFGVPLASAQALQHLWKQKIIAKSETVFDSTTQVNDLVLDKTGTLTRGKFRLQDLRVVGRCSPEDKDMRLLRELVGRSLHPVSKAIAAAWDEQATWRALGLPAPTGKPPLEELVVEEFPGRGLLGRSQGRELLRVGKASFCFPHESAADRGEEQMPQGDELASVVWVAFASGGRLRLELADTPREGAEELLTWAAQQKLAVHVWSGDARATVERWISRFRSQIPHLQISGTGDMAPEEKLAALKKLQGQGKTVMMLGDGVNDTAALAQAHVGVAVQGGVDVSMSTADVSLATPDLSVVKRFFEGAQKSVRVQQRVLALSGFYNAIALGSAAAGFVHPIVAALLMPLSSLSLFLLVNRSLSGEEA